MAVNLRKKYYGKKEVSKKNRIYRYQLDFYHNGKRIRETIKKVDVYLVIQNATIYSIAKYKPSNQKELLSIHGIGEKKVEKYGDEILSIINFI